MSGIPHRRQVSTGLPIAKGAGESVNNIEAAREKAVKALHLLRPSPEIRASLLDDTVSHALLNAF